MAYDVAMSIVDRLHGQFAIIARTIVTMLADKRGSAWDGMEASIHAVRLARYIMLAVQGLSPEVKKDFLYVLEHGSVTLPADK